MVVVQAIIDILPIKIGCQFADSLKSIQVLI